MLLERRIRHLELLSKVGKAQLRLFWVGASVALFLVVYGVVIAVIVVRSRGSSGSGRGNWVGGGFFGFGLGEICRDDLFFVFG